MGWDISRVSQERAPADDAETNLNNTEPSIHFTATNKSYNIDFSSVCIIIHIDIKLLWVDNYRSTQNFAQP